MKALSKTIRRVVQRDGTGCGIACAAMLSRRSYFDVRRAARRVLGDVARYWTDSSQLRKIMAPYHVSLGPEVTIRTWQQIKAPALVAVQWKPRRGTCHWVVFIPDSRGGFVLD